jgi:hypothetical protein
MPKAKTPVDGCKTDPECAQSIPLLRDPLPNVPTPSSEHLDHFGSHSGRQRHSYEHEALVDGVGQSKLSC